MLLWVSGCPSPSPSIHFKAQGNFVFLKHIEILTLYEKKKSMDIIAVLRSELLTLIILP